MQLGRASQARTVTPGEPACRPQHNRNELERHDWLSLIRASTVVGAATSSRRTLVAVRCAVKVSHPDGPAAWLGWPIRLYIAAIERSSTTVSSSMTSPAF